MEQKNTKHIDMSLTKDVQGLYAEYTDNRNSGTPQ